MREGSPNQCSSAASLNGLRPEAKSLFRNILAVSPYGSRFCPDPFRSKRTKPFRINILRTMTEKMWSDRSHAKSLFWNVLPVSYCGSIFCKDPRQAIQDKPLRMNILEKEREKKLRASILSGSLAQSRQTTQQIGTRETSPYEFSAGPPTAPNRESRNKKETP